MEWETLLTIEAQSLGLRYFVVNTLGLVMIADLRELRTGMSRMRTFGSRRTVVSYRMADGRQQVHIEHLPDIEDVEMDDVKESTAMFHPTATKAPGHWLTKRILHILGAHVVTGRAYEFPDYLTFSKEVSIEVVVGVVTACVAIIVIRLVAARKSTLRKEREMLEFRITAEERTAASQGRDFGHCWVYLVTDRPIE